jgi:hypothetical protein
MTYEESKIIDFLKGSPNDFVARREIARKAMSRQVFDEDPHWADASLVSLVNMDILEQNENGHYKIKKFEG